MTNPDKPDYTHGSNGTKPSKSIDYTNGDPLDSENLDYFINTPFEKIKDSIDRLVAIDSDGDGKVDEAEQADNATNVTATYKGNDIDSNGDGKVDSADNADDAINVTSTYKGNDLDSNGDGKVDAADTADNTTAYKNNDIDSNGDGKVDNADVADTANLYKNNDIDSDGDGVVDEADYAATAGDADTVDGLQASTLDSRTKIFNESLSSNLSKTETLSATINDITNLQYIEWGINENANSNSYAKIDVNYKNSFTDTFIDEGTQGAFSSFSGVSLTKNLSNDQINSVYLEIAVNGEGSSLDSAYVQAVGYKL